ncbi:hypothetical protein LIER_30594 [Lithospermum erythrorhizon]|uniref:Uncharacterized protein n=1 Tax=Lithospermum erythrorhizon TaxID=34254 RepID=A0AAV3RS64_LITER
MDARVPKMWVPLEKADNLRSPLTNDTFVALEKLRRIFKHKLHWKSFYEEGVLIRTGLIHDKEFDLYENPIPWGKRPSDGAILQGKEKRARAAFELSNPPKSSIPPPPFPDYETLMAAGFLTPEFLTPPYKLPGG